MPKKSMSPAARENVTKGARRTAITKRIAALKQCDLTDVEAEIANLKSKVAELEEIRSIVLRLRDPGKGHKPASEPQVGGQDNFGDKAAKNGSAEPAGGKEELVFSLVRNLGPIACDELVRQTGLTAQDIQRILIRNEDVKVGAKGYFFSKSARG